MLGPQLHFPLRRRRLLLPGASRPPPTPCLGLGQDTSISPQRHQGHNFDPTQIVKVVERETIEDGSLRQLMILGRLFSGPAPASIQPLPS